MKLEPRQVLSQALANLKPWISRIQARRSSLEWQAVVAIGVLAAGLSGWTARDKADSRIDQARELARIGQRIEAAERAFQPAVEAESLAWRQSDAELRRIAAGARDPLDLAHEIADRAERAGIYNLQVGLAATDTMRTPDERVGGDWLLASRDEAVLVRLRSDLSRIASLVAMLPPQAELGTVTLSPAGPDEFTASLFIFTRLLVPPPGNG